MLDAVTAALGRDSERLGSDHALAMPRSTYRSLTPHKKKVMAFLVGALTNKQVTAQTNLSETTVTIQRAQPMNKMAARAVPDLVRKAEALRVCPIEPTYVSRSVRDMDPPMTSGTGWRRP